MGELELIYLFRPYLSPLLSSLSFFLLLLLRSRLSALALTAALQASASSSLSFSFSLSLGEFLFFSPFFPSVSVTETMEIDYRSIEYYLQLNVLGNLSRRWMHATCGSRKESLDPKI